MTPPSAPTATEVERELAIIPVPAEGRGYSTSGLQTLAPRVYGAYFTPRGTPRPKTALVFMHPTSIFMDHYALAPLAAAGYGALGLNSRFVNNEAAMIVEQVVLDLAAGVRFLRERGAERVILVGNSGGGGLMALYQSQAETPTITQTPAGDPPDLTRADLPRADAIVTMAAHTGRAQVLTEYLDPAVLDEHDEWSNDPSLDMFDPRNGPPYSQEFVARYRAAQLARNRRITTWAQERLRWLAERTDGLARDEPFIVYRTMADLRFLDLSLDPSDRAPGTTWGDPRVVNHAALSIGRYTSLRSWLSQWAVDTSNYHGPRHIAQTSVPVLVMSYTADQVCFPGHAKAFFAAVPHPNKRYVEIAGATHYLNGQSEALPTVIGTIDGWLKEQGLA